MNIFTRLKTRIVKTPPPPRPPCNQAMNARKFNELLYEDQYRKKNPINRAMPVMLTVQNTMRCNLHCAICQRRFYPAPSIPDIDPEIFVDKIADDLFPYISIMQTSVMGEPLLAPNMKVIIEQAKKHDLKINVTTNGTLLSDEKRVKELLPVLQAVHVSFDAATKRSYESIRIGARYEDTVAAIRTFSLLRNSLPDNERPSFILACVLMRRNIEELPDMVVLAKKLGFTGIYGSHLVVFDPSLENESLSRHKELENRYFLLARQKANELGMPIVLPAPHDLAGGPHVPDADQASGKSVIYTCKFPWYACWITSDLKVIPCCGPHPDKPVMGDLRKERFEDIWNNLHYQKLRAAFRSNDPPHFCRACNLLEVITPSDIQ